jgi:hypothetical protein
VHTTSSQTLQVDGISVLKAHGRDCKSIQPNSLEETVESRKIVIAAALQRSAFPSSRDKPAILYVRIAIIPTARFRTPGQPQKRIRRHNKITVKSAFGMITTGWHEIRNPYFSAGLLLNGPKHFRQSNSVFIPRLTGVAAEIADGLKVNASHGR